MTAMARLNVRVEIVMNTALATPTPRQDMVTIPRPAPAAVMSTARAISNLLPVMVMTLPPAAAAGREILTAPRLTILTHMGPTIRNHQAMEEIMMTPTALQTPKLDYQV